MRGLHVNNGGPYFLRGHRPASVFGASHGLDGFLRWQVDNEAFGGLWGDLVSRLSFSGWPWKLPSRLIISERERTFCAEALRRPLRGCGDGLCFRAMRDSGAHRQDIVNMARKPAPAAGASSSSRHVRRILW